MDRGSYEPKKDVQDFLTNNYFIKIYEDLTENKEYQNLFDPLEFFNLLYEYIYIIKYNNKRPLDVVNQIRGLDLDKQQLHFLLKRLMGSFNHKSFPFYLGIGRKNEEDKRCLTFIRKEWKKLDDELFKPAQPVSVEEEEETHVLSPDEVEFQKVREHIDAFENTENKIQYVNKVKTRYMQDNWQNYNPDYPMNNHFIYNCELEIERLKDIMNTENKPSINTSNLSLGHYSNSQVVLIFYYFFKFCGLELRKNIDVSTMAKFIHLISGKEYKGIDNSGYYKKLKNNVPNFKSDKELKNDLLTIKPLFQQTELKEIVKMIDNEIERCN